MTLSQGYISDSEYEGEVLDASDSPTRHEITRKFDQEVLFSQGNTIESYKEAHDSSLSQIFRDAQGEDDLDEFKDLVEDVRPNSLSAITITPGSSRFPSSSTSSPLSSVPSDLLTPENLFDLLLSEQTAHQDHAPQDNEPDPLQAGHLTESSITHNLEFVPDNSIRRSLRPRTNYQLHPYTMERAVYESRLRGYGIRPDRVQEVSHTHRSSTVNHNQNSSQNEDSQFIPTSSQQDATDLNLDRTFERAFEKRMGVSSKPSQKKQHDQREKIVHHPFNITDIDNDSINKRKRLRIEVSSDESDTEILSSRRSDSGIELSVSDAPVEVSDEEDDAGEEENMSTLEQIRKQLRGVLPPSFVLLESARSAASRSSNSTHRKTPEIYLDEPRRGLAKRKIGPIAPSTPFINHLIESSVSTPHRSPRNPLTPTRATTPLSIDRSPDIIDDTMEEDHIDHMITSSRSGPGQRKRHQTKVPSDKAHSSGSRSNNDNRNYYQRADRSSKSLDSYLNHNPRTTNIVEACDLHQRETQQPPPLFMRVASRTHQRKMSSKTRNPSSNKSRNPYIRIAEVPPKQQSVNTSIHLQSNNHRQPLRPILTSTSNNLNAMKRKPNKKLFVVNSLYDKREPRMEARTTVLQEESGEYAIRRAKKHLKRQMQTYFPMIANEHHGVHGLGFSENMEYDTDPPEFGRRAKEIEVEDAASPVSPVKAFQPEITSYFGPTAEFSSTFGILPFPPSVKFASQTFVATYNFPALLYSHSDNSSLGLGVILSEGFGNLNWTSISGGALASDFERCMNLVENIIDLSLEEFSNDAMESKYLAVYEFFKYAAGDFSGKPVGSSVINTLAATMAKIQDIWSSEEYRDKLLDLTSGFCRLTFTVASFSTLLFYMEASKRRFNGPIDNRLLLLITTSGKSLLTKLCQLHVSNLNELIRHHRSRQGDEINLEYGGYILELVYILIHTLDCTAKINEDSGLRFFSLLRKSMPQQESIEAYEYTWRCIFTFSAFYLLGSHGDQTTLPNWKLIQSMGSKVFNKESSIVPPLYLKAFTSRCLVLMNTWKWPSSRSFVQYLYRIFANNKFRNLEQEGGYSLPDFVIDYQEAQRLDAADTIFHVFLKILILTLNEFKQQDDSVKMSKLTDIVTPLNGRSYLMTSELQIFDLESVANQYSLLLVLTQFSLPQDCMRSVEQLRNLIVLQNSHIQTRLLSLKAWYLLMKILIRKGHDGSIIEGAMNWYKSLITMSLVEFSSLDKPDSVQDSIENNRRSGNLKWYEWFFHDALGLQHSLISDVTLLASSTNWILLLYEGIFEIVKHNISANASNLVIKIVTQYVESGETLLRPSYNISMPVDDDSQQSLFDNGNADDLMIQLTNMFEDENKKYGRAIADHLSEVALDGYYRLLSNFMGNAGYTEEKYARDLLDGWAVSINFTIRYGAEDWNRFAYGSYGWHWLGVKNLGGVYNPLLMARIIIRSGDQTRIPDELLMELLMKYLFYKNCTFVGDFFSAMKKRYNEILLVQGIGDNVTEKPGDFKKSRNLIVKQLLKRLGESIRDSSIEKNVGEKLLQACTNTMKEHIEIHPGEIYLRFVQQTLGWIMEFCAEVSQSESVKINWFMDPKNFALASHTIFYSAAKTKSYLTRDTNHPRNRLNIASYLISSLEASMMDNMGVTFEKSLMQAMIPDELDDSSSKLRRDQSVHFVVNDLLASYIDIARFNSSAILFVPTIMTVIRKICEHGYESSWIISIESLQEHLIKPALGLIMDVVKRPRSIVQDSMILPIITRTFDSLSTIVSEQLQTPSLNFLNELKDSLHIALLCICFLMESSSKYDSFGLPLPTLNTRETTQDHTSKYIQSVILHSIENISISYEHMSRGMELEKGVLEMSSLQSLLRYIQSIFQHKENVQKFSPEAEAVVTILSMNIRRSSMLSWLIRTTQLDLISDYVPSTTIDTICI